MDVVTLIGSLGVALLLLAFFLSLFKFIAQDGFAYIGMNVGGAALACWSSWIIAFMPFVILEAVWCWWPRRPSSTERTSQAQTS